MPRNKKSTKILQRKGIPFQFINLAERGLSKGELNSVINVIDVDDLMDREGREYERRNLKYLTHNGEEELLIIPFSSRPPS